MSYPRHHRRHRQRRPGLAGDHRYSISKPPECSRALRVNALEDVPEDRVVDVLGLVLASEVASRMFGPAVMAMVLEEANLPNMLLSETKETAWMFL